MRLKRSYTCTLFVLTFCALSASAQNIVGMKILIGANAPAFIAFPSEVTNARWDDNEMNTFYKFSTRNENTMQISYNGKEHPPAGGFSVVEGKNTHIFTLVFKKDYDINKDPVLYYDFSDKSKLKAAAEQAGRNTTLAAAQQEDTSQPLQGQQETKANEEAQRKEEEQRKKEMILAQQQKQKELEARQKAEAAKARKEEEAREAAIAEARAEARRKETEQQKARAAEAALAKAEQEEARKKAAEELRLQKEREAEEQKIAQEAARQREQERLEQDKAKAEKDRLAREEAEKKRLAALEEKERQARVRREQAEAERRRKAEQAREEAEAKRKAQEEAEARLLALEKEREEARENARYSLAGLWNRYGKKGINLYEIPEEQHHFNNTDFYIAADTARNFTQSQRFLTEPARLAIAPAPQQGITASLKSISFEDAIAYYRISIQNDSREDYLVGANVLAWYNPDGSPKVYLKCSYLTYIGFFPLVKPGETIEYVYATRAANINDEDKLVLTIKERRAGHPAFELLFDGTVYRKELARIETPLRPGTGKNKTMTEEEGRSGKEKKKRSGKKRKDSGENQDRGID